MKQIFKFKEPARSQIINRHGTNCVFCGAPANGGIHHAFSGARRPEGFDPNKHNVSDWWNGFPLCLKAHNQIHHFPKETCNNRLDNREYLQRWAQTQFDGFFRYETGNNKTP